MPKQKRTAASAPPPAARRFAIPYWQPILLALVAFCVYGNALRAGFVWDDDRQVLQNPYIRDAGHLPKIFATDVWAFKGVEYRSNYYRPLMHIGYMVTYQIFGLKAGAFHAVNNFFHVLNTLLVYGLLFLLFRNGWLAFLSGLLFATHPIHTEAVIWVASLPEVTVTFFYLLAFGLYVLPQTWNRPAGIYRVLSPAAFFMALLCKEMALTLPLILIAYEWVCRKSAPAKALVAVSLYALPVVLYLLLRHNALDGLMAGDTHPEVQGLASVWSTIVLTARYGWKLLVPVPLNFFYLFTPNQSPAEPAVLGALALLAAWGWGAWRLRTAHPPLAFGLLWILITLLPALAIHRVGENVFTERYLYLPSVGFCWCVVYALLAWVDRLSLTETRKPAAITLSAVFILAALYSIATWVRADDYKDDLTMFTKTLAQSPGAVSLHNGLGTIHLNRRQYDLAEKEFTEALRYKPGLREARMNLGVVYYLKGLNDAAVNEYKEVLRSHPRYAEAYYNLGLAYLKDRASRPAVDAFRQAIQWNPGYAKAHNGLGMAYTQQGLLDEAIRQYQEALRLNPNLTEARTNLEKVTARKGP